MPCSYDIWVRVTWQKTMGALRVGPLRACPACQVGSLVMIKPTTKRFRYLARLLYLAIKNGSWHGLIEWLTWVENCWCTTKYFNLAIWLQRKQVWPGTMNNNVGRELPPSAQNKAPAQAAVLHNNAEEWQDNGEQDQEGKLRLLHTTTKQRFVKVCQASDSCEHVVNWTVQLPSHRHVYSS